MSAKSTNEKKTPISPTPRMTLLDSELAAFNKICDFVQQLNEVFGAKYHSLELYNHLLTKTNISHKNAIKKNVKLFEEFCKRNSDAIINKDGSKLASGNIMYSEKVAIDMTKIFGDEDMDDETETLIWTHFLVIHATIDPTSGARAMLKKLKENSSKEGEFLDGFMNKIEQSVSKEQLNGDHMSAASSILQSGVLNDLVGSIDNGVKSGNLDLGKLVGTVQQMLSGLNMGGDGGGGDMGGIMNIMGMLGGAGGGGGLAGLNAEQVHEQIEQKMQIELQKEKAERKK